VSFGVFAGSLLPPDPGERQVAAVAPDVLDRSFETLAPNRTNGT